MINKNKTSRVILALLMTLNINFVSPSYTNATPVEDNYYNPYSHGRDLENNTYGANGESNSERQAREKKEAEAKKLAEQQAKANANANANQQAQSNADKFAKFNAEYGGDTNNKDTFTKIDDGKTKDDEGTNRIKYNNDNAFSDESMKKYEEKAKAECIQATSDLIKSGKSVKINGKLTTNVDDICNAQTIKDLGMCFATFSSSETGNYTEPSEEIRKQCIEVDVLADKNLAKAEDAEENLNWFSKQFNSLRDSLANTLKEHGFDTVSEIVKSITLQDVVEEIVITAGLAAVTALTGGAAGVVLVGRLGTIANKVRKISNLSKAVGVSSKASVKAKQLTTALKEARTAIRNEKIPAKNYSELEKRFIEEAERYSNGKKFSNLEEAQKFVREATVSAEKNADKGLKGLQKVSKEINSFKNQNLKELGGDSIKTLEKMKNGEAIEKYEKGLTAAQNKLAKETDKLQKGIQNKYDEALTNVRNYETEIGRQKALQQEAIKTLESDTIKKLNTEELGKELQKATSNKRTQKVVHNAGKIGLSLEGVNLTKDTLNKIQEVNQPKDTPENLTKEKEVKESIRDGYSKRQEYIANTKYADKLQELKDLQGKEKQINDIPYNERLSALNNHNKEVSDLTNKITNDIANDNAEFKNSIDRVTSLNNEISSINHQLDNHPSVQSSEGRQDISKDVNAQANNIESQYNSLKNK